MLAHLDATVGDGAAADGFVGKVDPEHALRVVDAVAERTNRHPAAPRIGYVDGFRASLQPAKGLGLTA